MVVVVVMVAVVDRAAMEHQGQLDRKATWENWAAQDLLVRAVVT